MTAIVDGKAARPCVGCGYCCKQTCCEVALRYFSPILRPEDRCPALGIIGDRYWCGLVLFRGQEFAKLIGAGTGCCSPLNSDRRKS